MAFGKKIKDWILNFKLFICLCAILDKIVIPGFGGLTLLYLIKAYIIGILKGALGSRAGSIAYSLFMAIFPGLVFMLNLVPYVPVEEFDKKFMDFIYELIPPQSLGFFQPIITDISQNERAGLLSIAGVLALFLTANGVNAIFGAFENAHYNEINRNFFRQYFVALCTAIILALLLVTTLVVLIYFEVALYLLNDKSLFSDGTNITLLNVGKNIFLIIMIYSIVATLYYFGTQEGRKSRFFSPGALMTTILFMLTTSLFGVYIDNFNNYNELYGSIGALLITMLYIWLNSNLILLGFDLNATLRKLKVLQNKN